MKKVLFIFFICALHSCTDFDDTAFVINGEYTHLIEDCGTTITSDSETEEEADTDIETEENCTESVVFYEDYTAHISINGSDTIAVVNYEINGKNITFYDDDGNMIDFSFSILSEESLYRLEDNETWNKSEVIEETDEVDETEEG
jgi:hypothetical protein